MQCPKCGSTMIPVFYGSNRTICSSFSCVMDTISLTDSEERDCSKCKHTWYDHIGWRDHLEGESRLRTNCRIIGCVCDSYSQY